MTWGRMRAVMTFLSAGEGDCSLPAGREVVLG